MIGTASPHSHPQVLASPRLAAHGSVIHGFATRQGGVSQGPFASLNLGQEIGDDPGAVSENLRRLSRRAGLPHLLTVTQVHGNEVVVIDADADPEQVGRLEADALVTAVPGQALAVRTADCVPLFLAAPDQGVVCAVHAGWRGTVAGIAGEAVACLRDRFGVPQESLVAAVGPSIRRCCFEVGAEVAERFTGELARAVVRGRGRPHVDLVAANLMVLEAAGVPHEAVDVLNACTACDPSRYYSHRRDQGRTGRHLSYIALRPGGRSGGGDRPVP